MTNKFLAKFERDLLFLNQNMIPQEPSGLKIEELDYEGSSDSEDERLNDTHVSKLVKALSNNDTFQGPLDLSKNDLTDQVSYRSLLTPFSECNLLEGSPQEGRKQEYHEAQPVEEQEPE